MLSFLADMKADVSETISSIANTHDKPLLRMSDCFIEIDMHEIPPIIKIRLCNWQPALADADLP